MKKTILILVMILAGNLMLPAQKTDSNRIRPIQTTFIYPLGTNGVDAHHFTNRMSFNVLAGFNGGVKGFEMAGIYNMVTGNMQGCQLAGIGNTVLGNCTGAQLGGIANISRMQMDGLQMAGITNYAKESDAAVQIAGINNMLRDTLSGVQLAGIGNYSNGIRYGLQTSGIANVSRNSVAGTQIAGISNLSGGNTTGMQMAGIANTSNGTTFGTQISGISNVSTKDMTGMQMAGISNVTSGKIQGVQIGGISNVAQILSGFQMGLINYADSLENGIPLGFLSIVRKNGYQKLEISASESLLGQIKVKTGVQRLYNIFAAGLNKSNAHNIWAFGYGVGTLVPFNDKFSMNADLVSYHVNDNRAWTNYLNSMNKLSLQTNYQINKHISVFAGVSANVFVSDLETWEGVERDHTPVPAVFSTIETHNTLIRFYPGIHAGIRL